LENGEVKRVARLELLDSTAHAGLRVNARADRRLGDARHFVPVILSEFPKLAAHYPILLTKAAETGSFFVGAMLGVEAGENLFLHAAGGQDSYRPLEMRRGPFFISGESLAIDRDHPRVGPAEGEMLFEADLQPTAYLRDIQSIMTQLHAGLEQTAQFVDRLLALKLVEPVDIDLRFDDGSRHRLEGLYTVSLERLHALDDRQALDLFRRGDLRLIHAMVGSLDQVPVLATMHNNRLAQGF
jgi:hypothetical protein